MKKQAWKYKDANREYWKITAQPSTTASVHAQWEINVSRQDLSGKWATIFNGYKNGQYHEPLGLDDCLMSWFQDHSATIIGMAKHAKHIK